MSDPETRERRARKFRAVKELNDNKGAFALRPVNPKKSEYKRRKLKVREIEIGEEEWSEE